MFVASNILHTASTVGRRSTELVRDVLDACVRSSLRVPARIYTQMYPYVLSVASTQKPLDSLLPEN